MDSKPIIAFDLHGVIFTPNWQKILSILWNYKCKLWLLTCAFRCRLVGRCLKLLFNNPTDEEFFAIFMTECPRLMPLALDLMNAHKPITETVNILEELKARGYCLHIISNIGQHRLKCLYERYPHIIDLFDEIKTNNGNACAMVKKPSKQFFLEYLCDYNPGNRQVIFVDDNRRNIVQAGQLGMIGIRFKNPERLKDQLKKLRLM
jgi:FMN phosphatase YigB (HAD superfamily)